MRTLTLVLLALLAGESAAQGVPGKNVQLDVTVASVTRQADTTTVTYVLSNRTTSAEPLFAFTVDAPSVITVSPPLPLDEWMVWTQYRGLAVARWSILSDTRVAPGAESPPLTFRALGVPGIVDARVTGHFERPVYTDAGDAPVDDDPFLGHSSVMRVLGVVVPPPGSTPRDLTARVSGLVTEACALAWIDNHGICNALQSKLTAAMQAFDQGNTSVALSALGDLVNHLNAQRGKHVNETAYQVLKLNVDAIIASIDT